MLKRALIGAMAAVCTIIIAAIALIAVLFGGASSLGSSGDEPSATAAEEIPPHILRLCMSSTQKYSPKIPWEVLCGVSSIETDHGRANLPGVRSGVNSYGCCAGYVQFHVLVNGSPVYRLRASETNGSTWGAFSVDGDGDGWKEVHNPEDAYPAAARYLQYESRQVAKNNECPDVSVGGYGPDVKRALWGYNHACWYVQSVLEKAVTYRSVTPTGGSTLDPDSIPLPGGFNNPSRQGYVQMPSSPNGAWVFQAFTCPAQRYGKPELIAVLYTVAMQWKQLYPNGWIMLGDLNASLAEHASHRWGVAVDLNATTNGRDRVADFSKVFGPYNQRATVQLGQLFLQTGMVKNLWYNDATVRSILYRYARDRGLPTPNIQFIKNHHHHFHVDISGNLGPESTPSC